MERCVQQTQLSQWDKVQFSVVNEGWGHLSMRGRVLPVH
jgi:hypothetical protein